MGFIRYLRYVRESFKFTVKSVYLFFQDFKYILMFSEVLSVSLELNFCFFFSTAVV